MSSRQQKIIYNTVVAQCGDEKSKIIDAINKSKTLEDFCKIFGSAEVFLNNEDAHKRKIFQALKDCAAEEIAQGLGNKDAGDFKEIFEDIAEGEKDHRVIQTFSSINELKQRNALLEREIRGSNLEINRKIKEIEELRQGLKERKEKNGAEAGLDSAKKTGKSILAVIALLAVLTVFALLTMGGLSVLGVAISFGSGGGALVALGTVITFAGIGGGVLALKGGYAGHLHEKSISDTNKQIEKLQTEIRESRSQNEVRDHEKRQNEVTINHLESAKKDILDLETNELTSTSKVRAQLQKLATSGEYFHLLQDYDKSPFAAHLSQRSSAASGERPTFARQASSASQGFAQKLAAEQYHLEIKNLNDPNSARLEDALKGSTSVALATSVPQKNQQANARG